MVKRGRPVLVVAAWRAVSNQATSDDTRIPQVWASCEGFSKYGQAALWIDLRICEDRDAAMSKNNTQPQVFELIR